MKYKKVSFVIPSRNTLKYLQWAYNSIRNNIGKEHELVLIDDASTDRTWEWLNHINESDENVIIYRNEGPERLGHTILYDKGVELATNELFIICHSDMYYTPNFVKNLLKNYSPKSVISATRIEPPLHPPGPEKLLEQYGIEPNEFQENGFLNRVKELEKAYKNKTTNGAFAPWLMSKEDFNAIGGHDPLFAPQSREDSDIFNRFYLAGYKLIQSRDSFVYHMTCRGSRFKDGLGKNSIEWQKTNYKGERNFWRKWGSMIKHDENLLPVISNKYNIRIIITTSDGYPKKDFIKLLEFIEPKVSQLVIIDPQRLYSEEVLAYKIEEQKITKYDMEEKVIYNPEKEMEMKDVEIFGTPNTLLSDNGRFLYYLTFFLDKIEEEGSYEYEENKIIIRKLKRDYYIDNIVLNKGD